MVELGDLEVRNDLCYLQSEQCLPACFHVVDVVAVVAGIERSLAEVSLEACAMMHQHQDDDGGGVYRFDGNSPVV